ncbi:MAG TPA: hypothetical protein VKI61_08605, partial [Chitinophagaceae bacterium]|nr:hypothetical protein [Chitinophagaceae bacterium]
DILEKYIIHFNEQRGPNIRLSVKINNGFAESFLQTTSTYIENFFKSFPCSNELTINKNNFIANFPTNSIFYGLHTASQNNLGPPLDRIVHGVQHNFSIIILKVFGQGIFDDELVNSFFIYAILKYFRTLEIISGNLFEVADGADKHIREFTKPSFLKTLENLFYESKVELADIADEMSASSWFSEELRWLDEWQLYCEGFIHDMQAFLPNYSRLDFSLIFFDKLSEQLNLQDYQKQTLIFMLIQTIKYQKASEHTV